MDALVGTTKQLDVTLIANGQPNLLADLDFSLTDPFGVAILTGVTPTNLGNGTYRVTIDGGLLSSPGDYSYLWSGIAQIGVPTSDDIYIPGILIVGYTSHNTTTLLELRHRTARRLNDLVIGVATAGSANSITDPNRTEEDLRGANIYLYGGTGRGQEREIGSIAAGVMGTLGSNMVPAPLAGTSYEIHKARHGWTVADYNSAINEAIESVRDQALYPVRYENMYLANDTREYVVPPGMDYINSVFSRNTAAPSYDGENDWMELSDTEGDYEIAVGRVLRIPDLPSIPTNYQLRIVGMRRPESLTTDESFTTIPAAYIVPKAAAILLTGHVGGAGVDPDSTAQLVAFLEQQAERYSPKGTRGINARRLV